jgi:hypothetical protein
MPRSSRLRSALRTGGLMGVCALAGGALFNVSASSQPRSQQARQPNPVTRAEALVRQGRQIFRFDDFCRAACGGGSPPARST